jgi:hypothetical protein
VYRALTVGRPERPDPDVIDVDVPRERIRPDQGYKVGARISVGDAGRTRMAGSIAVGVILTGFVLAAIGPLVPSLPEIPIAPVPSRSSATPLPDVAIFDPPATTRFVPVAAGGLRWLDPARGAMSGDAYTAPRGNLFVDAEGRAVCVCLEVPWSKELQVNRVTVQRFSAAGAEIARLPLYELQAADRLEGGSTIQVDAAIAPDGSKLWIVHAVLGETGWEIGVDRVDLATLAVDASRVVETILAPASESDPAIGSGGDGWVVEARSAVRAAIRVSPDGSKLAVIESVFSGPSGHPADADAGKGLPAFQLQRLVIDSDLDPRVEPEVAVPAHDATFERCDGERAAWATDRDFVTICERPQGTGVQPYVRIESADDTTRELAVGPAVGTRDSEWLLDSRQGVLYRWSTLAHVFARLDVRGGSAMTLAIDRTDVGVGDVGIWPSAGGAASSPWAPLTGPDIFLGPARVVGSADGALIYALGYRSVADDLRDDRLASTGIWVFDAGRAELVAHWAPEAYYDQIGYAPGWERLVTLAMPGVDGDGGAADWGPSLRFHDARTGDVTELLGDVQEPSGFVPVIVAPNAPGGIAGF